VKEEREKLRAHYTIHGKLRKRLIEEEQKAVEKKKENTIM